MSSLPQKYTHVVVAVDVALFTVVNNELRVLLMKLAKPPYENAWALPGGLIKSAESLDDAAKRELQERTGITGVYTEQLYTFGAVDRDPFGRVVSTAYFALVPYTSNAVMSAATTHDLAWFAIDKLPSLGYDHASMIDYAVERIRSKLRYTTIVYSVLPKEFTLTQLQSIYQVILGRTLDKRNFRKKILSLNMILPVGKKISGLPNRPAELFRFRRQKTEILNIL